MIDDRLVRELAGTIEEAPIEELHAILGQLEWMKSTASFRLYAAANHSRNNDAKENDKLIEVKEASQILKVSENYLYQNSKSLPFTVRLGRRLLFSKQGIERYIHQNQG